MDVSAIESLIDTDRSAAGTALDQALRTNHSTGDARGMLALHLLAARYWRADAQQASFHTTHAYVYALELGAWETVNRLHAELAREGKI